MTFPTDSKSSGAGGAGSSPSSDSATVVSQAGTPPSFRGKPSRALYHQLGDVLTTLAVPAAFIVLWWIAVALRMFPASLVPSPWTVCKALIQWVFGGPRGGPYSGTWLEAALASGGRVLAGFSIAAAAGIIIGVLAGYFKRFGRLIDPFIQLLRPIPVTAWVPLSLVFFGFGFSGALFLIALGAFFPLFVNTTEAIRGASKTLLKVGRMLGAGPLNMLTLFVIPAALPGIFVGLRLGMGISWVLVIVAELLSVKAGIGYTLLDAYSFARFDVIIAAMISLGVLGFMSDRLIIAVQRILLRWHQEVTIHAE